VRQLVIKVLKIVRDWAPRNWLANWLVRAWLVRWPLSELFSKSVGHRVSHLEFGAIYF